MTQKLKLFTKHGFGYYCSNNNKKNKSFLFVGCK